MKKCTIKIRKFEPKDRDSIVEIWYKASIIAHDFIPKEIWEAEKTTIRDQYLPLAETWVAEEEGKVIGFISLLDQYIGGLFVEPSQQGKGAGTQLIQRAQEEKGHLTVGVYSKNSAARGFYRKHGFRKTNEELQTETGEIVINKAWKQAGDSVKSGESKPAAIRALVIEDYDAVIELWQSTEGIGLSEADSWENIRRFLARNPCLSSVAEKDGEILGAVLCGHDSRRGYLHHLAVRSDRRLQGIGKRLVDISLENLKAEGIDKCHIFVFRENEKGVAFWAQNEWKARLDLTIMSKRT
ncbi:Acetyltransferase, GNAT [Desulfitobacterium hafniense]|uniref:Acetyltransferase, GNAT n=1 Tax=Desulfitobacterium hafniense TaxID=49338 RepID=A0A098AZ97_DESHA|nr:N-acetyltransferase [Desulfitobacterium hafniense]CDX01440.1 Acetyltransferase, GNAT [Desulfitobacterium hafniense]